MKAKRRTVTSSPRVAEQKYPTPPKGPPGRSRATAASAQPVRDSRERPRPIAADAVDLSVDLGRGLVLSNPILVASGAFGYGVESADAVEIDRLGGFCTRGTTLKARPGNPAPRMIETAGGLLNAVGLQNPGVDAVLERYAPKWATWRTPVIVNVAGGSVREFVELVRRLDGAAGVAGIELNLSCPNADSGGVQFALDTAAAAELTAAVRRATDLPLLVKLSSDAADVGAVARAVADAGADVLTAINTVTGLAVAPDRTRSLLGATYGGLSGPAIKPIALRVVFEVAQAVKIPVIAAGGVSGLTDVLDFLAVGAVAVQLGTAAFADPALPVRLASDLAEACGARGLTMYRDLVGTALPKKPAQASTKGVEYRP
jgi:dihydroorotate dehydrogenase (NAD+) catalytic subunit